MVRDESRLAAQISMEEIIVTVNEDTIYELIRFANETRFEDIPEETVKNAKKFIIDIVACITAGSTAPSCPEVVDLVSKWGGAEQSSVLVYGNKVPVFQAAYLNTLMGHSRDFDDTLDDVVLHATVSVIPTCFAVAQEMGDTTGEELLRAIIMGVDVMARLSYGAGKSVYESGWVFTALFAYFACACSAAMLRRMSTEEVVNTVGIVLSQAGGIYSATQESTLTKRMQPAFAAQAATQAAYLTGVGVTGVKGIVDGPKGLYNVYFGGAYDAQRIVEGLGEVYHIDRLAVKPYPCCRYTHSAIDGVRKLMAEHGILAQEVQRIDVGTSNMVVNTVCEPLEVRRNPQTVVNGQFSIPFTMASALVNGTVTFDTFDGANRNNPEVLRIANATYPYVDDEIDAKYGKSCSPSRVRITTERGVFETCVTDLWGGPGNPMSYEDVVEKLMSVRPLSALPVIEGGFERVVEETERLDAAEDLSAFFDALEGAYRR